ncbi:hypothetical protein GCM10023205_40720 [Yinghuangia aomiensis]|uniref:Uncharacterized protein n=1 Tax=Yinghuangia aomiensis TaxID=676205 RepID=A0ABP9HHD3_9ACTN
MPSLGPTPEWVREDVCTFCPSLLFGLGDFDVAERPGPRWPWNPDLALRVDLASGKAVCVHPHKVRLGAGRYASEGLVPDAAGWAEPEPVGEPDPRPGPPPGAIPQRLARRPAFRARRPRREAPAPEASPHLTASVPGDPTRLGAWLSELLSGATPDARADLLGEAEAAARTRHPDEIVLAAMREALAGG